MVYIRNYNGRRTWSSLKKKLKYSCTQYGSGLCYPNVSFFIVFLLQPPRQCNDKSANLECDRTRMRSRDGSYKIIYTIGISFFFIKHTALRSKNTDWLSRSQNNMYVVMDSAIKIKLERVLFQYKTDTTINSLIFTMIQQRNYCWC